MTVKMIQNLENKMESQINSLETRIEKIREMFNKDLEEIKKSQSIMNNAINEIKNTLEGNNSRILRQKIFSVSHQHLSSSRKELEGEELRWRRSRMGRTLSPPQIHQ